jgi:hypothetical protein
MGKKKADNDNECQIKAGYDSNGALHLFIIEKSVETYENTYDYLINARDIIINQDGVQEQEYFFEICKTKGIY